MPKSGNGGWFRFRINALWHYCAEGLERGELCRTLCGKVYSVNAYTQQNTQPSRGVCHECVRQLEDKLNEQ